jgi:hypothetical protein
MRVIVAVWKTHRPGIGEWGGAWYVRSVVYDRGPDLDLNWTIDPGEAHRFEDKALLDRCVTLLTNYDSPYHNFSVREL